MCKILLFAFVLLPSTLSFTQDTRHFTFHYAVTISEVPKGHKIEIWFPEAHSDPFQDVSILSVTGDLPLTRTHTAKFGNRSFHAITPASAKSQYIFDVEYDVVRHEHCALSCDGMHSRPIKTSAKDVNEFLGPDRLVPISGELAEIAAKQVRGHTSTMERARALYDYVFFTMRYDKSGSGWGRGDAVWACDSKRGNCTDFHSVFISMARSQGIAARFQIGFSVPMNNASGEIPGYHCWAEFYDSHYGWVPVDISEAWKNPDKKDYFFGAHDANRFQLSMGRDIILNPPQAGEALNFFVYPYVEVDQKKWENVVNHFSFTNVTTRSQTRASR